MERDRLPLFRDQGETCREPGAHRHPCRSGQ
jgi:hypothetical protein